SVAQQVSRTSLHTRTGHGKAWGEGAPRTNGPAATKYHFKLGLLRRASTFMPNAPTRKASGRKMKVIQLRRHRLALSSSECFESRIVTDLYIYGLLVHVHA